MFEGSCHCGELRWELQSTPVSATACNCTVCRRYGALWAYDFEDDGIKVFGPATPYTHGDCSLSFNFCPRCGCLAYWRAMAPDENGRRRLAVNLRLADPGRVHMVPVTRFDGLDSFQRLPGEHRCVGDLWS